MGITAADRDHFGVLTAAAVVLEGVTLARRSATLMAPLRVGSASERAPDDPALVALATTGLTSAATTKPGTRQRDWPKITSMITTFTAVAALLFTALSLNETRNQLAISEQSQINDRYTAAINQIGTQGNDHLETRLGGIYALERLAKDSPRDQSTIVVVLSAFVRSNSPIPVAGQAACPSSVTLDVQAALTVLGRRDPHQDNGAPVDLSQSCLARANLAGAHLANVDLSGSDLSGASFTGTDLTSADLNDADLNDVAFDHAKLRWASLSDAKLNHAGFYHADLSRSLLTAADATEADFENANLNTAELTNATFTSSDFTEASLLDANFSSSDLIGAQFSSADISGTILTDAKLNRYTLCGANGIPIC